MDPQDQLIADVMGQERRTVEEKKVIYPKADEAGVTISELEVNGVPVRSFSTRIPNAGRVEILVSVESIRRSRDRASAAPSGAPPARSHPRRRQRGTTARR